MQMAIGQCEGYIWFTAIYRSNKPWANTHDFIPAMSISFSLFTVRIFQTDSPSYPPPHLRHLAKSLPVPKGITPTLGWCVKGFRSATKQVNSLEMIWSDVELTLDSTFFGNNYGGCSHWPICIDADERRCVKYQCFLFPDCASLFSILPLVEL